VNLTYMLELIFWWISPIQPLFFFFCYQTLKNCDAFKTTIKINRNTLNFDLNISLKGIFSYKRMVWYKRKYFLSKKYGITFTSLHLMQKKWNKNNKGYSLRILNKVINKLHSYANSKGRDKSPLYVRAYTSPLPTKMNKIKDSK